MFPMGWGMYDALDRIYESTPDTIRPFLLKWYAIIHPKISWQHRKREYQTLERFIEEFFDNEHEYHALGEEFIDSRIMEIGKSAWDECPSDQTFYDAHFIYCKKLYSALRKVQPEVVVETGVFHGVSTATVLLALEKNGQGQLYSIDEWRVRYPTLDPDNPSEVPPTADVARKHPSCAEPGSHIPITGKGAGWIIPDDLHHRWELREGRYLEELPKLLDELGSIDCYIHDSNHSESDMAAEFELAWQHLVEGGLLISNHTGWNDVFDRFVDEHNGDAGLICYEYDYRSILNGLYDGPCQAGYCRKN